MNTSWHYICRSRNRLFQVLSVAMVAAFMTGCTTSYMGERVRDMADIFTFTVGSGAGGKIRVGPIQCGLLVEQDLAGLRNGSAGCWLNAHSMYDKDFLILPLFWFGVDAFDAGGAKCDNGPRSKLSTLLKPLPFVILPSKGFDLEQISIDYMRHYAQIEVVAALGPAVRVGFNPIELVDFLLGWFGLDVLRDDCPGMRESSFNKCEDLKESICGPT